MSLSIWRFIILIGALVVFASMIGLLMKNPQDKARRVLVNASSGFVVMLLVNMFLPALGISVPLNLLSFGAASIFGIPGVALAAALNLIV
ncbi:MAG: pro-sigmaK processing inhibitor BofA family protein [Oscillospiraceae bacterium]|jgi:pro-sigmaK processing inhibitor BofA|nr:pro-sigmaK processing inhibitor BofA family protein [Oscillospiraceae bacterium]